MKSEDYNAGIVSVVSDCVTNGESACDNLTQGLERKAPPSDSVPYYSPVSEHEAMQMDLLELHKFCAGKATDANAEHSDAHAHETKVHEIIRNNFPFFLALRSRLRKPGRREKIEGIDSWTEWIDRYFSWCSRRTVFRTFRKIEQRVDLLRDLAAEPRKDRPRWLPTQKEIKGLIDAAPIGAQISGLLLTDNPDLELAKELAGKYLRLQPSGDLDRNLFPAPVTTTDSSDLFCPTNYNETFPFYPPLTIHPTLGVTGIWFCRPDQRLAGLFYGSYPRSFLKRALSLFPNAGRVLHIPSGTLANLPAGHVTADLVQDDLRRPMVRADAHNLPFAAKSFDLVLCDRPYKDEDAKKYGTSPLSMPILMKETLRVLKPLGHLGILDLITFPVCRKTEWQLRGVIGVVPWSNSRFRTFSILQKPRSFGDGLDEAENVDDAGRTFAILQKAA
jgi:hypothetical protein